MWESNDNNDLINRSNEVDNIPIFTEQFLEHNKQRETELRNLKKMTTDCEEGNAMLQKHIEDINITIKQLENEIEDKINSNANLYNHLNLIKTNLYKQFQNTPIPGTKEYPTPETIDTYIQKLLQFSKSNNNSKEMDDIKNMIQEVLNKSNQL